MEQQGLGLILQQHCPEALVGGIVKEVSLLKNKMSFFLFKVGIFKATAFVKWEPERAKMAAKPPIFASDIELLCGKELLQQKFISFFYHNATKCEIYFSNLEKLKRNIFPQKT